MGLRRLPRTRCAGLGRTSTSRRTGLPTVRRLQLDKPKQLLESTIISTSPANPVRIIIRLRLNPIPEHRLRSRNAVNAGHDLLTKPTRITFDRPIRPRQNDGRLHQPPIPLRHLPELRPQRLLVQELSSGHADRIRQLGARLCQEACPVRTNAYNPTYFRRLLLEECGGYAWTRYGCNRPQPR